MSHRVHHLHTLIAFAGLALVAGPVSAAVRYVSPSGSTSSDGASPATAWSMAKANSSLVAGDVALILPGTYSTSIQPAASGTAGARITYLGNLSDPGAVTVPSIRVATSYISVKGVRSTASIRLSHPARFDSVAWCIGGGVDFWAAKNSMVARNTINGDVYFMANGGNPCYTSQNLDPACFANSEYDTLRGNRINLGNIIPADRSFEFKAWTQRCLIDSNQVTGTFSDPGGTLPDGGIALVSYNSYYQTFRDNKWQFEIAQNHHNYPSTTWDVVYLRDSLHTTVFERDTFLVGLNSPTTNRARMTMSASGSFPGSVRDVTLLDCFIQLPGDMFWQNDFKGWRLQNTVIHSRSGIPLNIGTDWRDSKILNCTVVATGEALRMEGGSSGLRMFGTQNEVRGNIFYSANAGPLGNYGGVVHWKDNTSNFASNQNLYFSPSFTSQPGDRSIMWSGYFASRPGTGTQWNTMNGNDGQSRYGSPLFVDSSFATFDPRLRSGSAAIGMGPGGADAGAIPFSAAGADATPPAAVADLVASNIASSSLLLSWTAPGDDGNTGLATAYELRVSTAPISAGTFTSASLLAPSPSPQLAGTAQTYVVTGLTPGTAYWFAIRARDEMGNWGAISNVLPVNTTATDTTPPAAIQDLTGGP
jgi:hypothetical protein